MPNSSHLTKPLCVVVLPNKRQIHIAVGLKCRGQEIITQLSKLLGIRDLHLFGLSLQKDKDYLFLDMEKKLATYFPKASKPAALPDRMVLHLRVQYYIGNGQQIVEGKARSLYYADLKNRVLSSQCYGHEGLYFQLAAYALQADFGDCTAEVETYFSPQDYFPPWILMKYGYDYVVQHTPDLHRELRGMAAYDASLLFIEEACSLSDVPLTFYSMSKDKKEKRASMLLGLALTGLHIYDIERSSGEYQLLYKFPWSSIDCLKFQGRRFGIRADGLTGNILVTYTQSVMHSQHLLKHMSNTHRMHLTTKHSFKLQRKERRHQREVYIGDSTDRESEESEDELPPMKLYLEKAQQHHADNMAAISVANARDEADFDEIELCVDEPKEMFVDDPEVNIQLTELLEGVSVDGPPLVNVSQWLDLTMEMKQVLKGRTCRLSLNGCMENVENLDSLNFFEEHVSTLLTYKHKQENILF